MPVVVRVAVQSDIAGMHRVRLAVRENRLTSSAITEKHYVPAIEETGRGWVAEENGIVLGFAVGNKTTGNIWALFVDPDQDGRGLGSLLHAAMVSWLFEQGLPRLWLGTRPAARRAWRLAVGPTSPLTSTGYQVDPRRKSNSVPESGTICI